MESIKILSLSGEVALAISGFSAVVLLFGGRRGGGWDELDQVRFRTLFTGTLCPLGLIAFALILDAFSVEQTVVWRVCSAAYLLVVATLSLRQFRVAAHGTSASPTLHLLQFSSVWYQGTLALLGTVLVLLLQLANAMTLNSFWPLLLAVWWSISLGVFEFLRLLLSSRRA